MDLKAGDIIAIRHYSTLNPFTSFVIDIDNDLITLKLMKDFSVNSLLEGEPVALGYESDGKVHLLSCDVVTIDFEAERVVLKFDSDSSFSNERSHERFPISLYADVSDKTTRKKHVVIIKDLSQYGMLIYSKADFTLHQTLEVDVYTEKDVVFIKGIIVRKIPGENYNKYGLMIQYENLKSISLVESYLKRLKFSYEQQIRRLKTDF